MASCSRPPSATLQTFGRDPKWLGGELGITMVLHTWSQTLEHHIHVHCVVTGGALAPEGDRWIPTKRRDFLFPVKALSRVFRGKYLTALQSAYAQDHLQFAGSTAPLGDARTFQRFLAPLWQQPWVVYAKPPFASAQHVLAYLGRYTHRVALSNDRLVALREGQVVFRWRDQAPQQPAQSHDAGCGGVHPTVPAARLTRRVHAHSPLWGAGQSLSDPQAGGMSPPVGAASTRPCVPRESAATVMRRLTGIDIERCPQCHQGRLVAIATLYPLRLPGPGVRDRPPTLRQVRTGPIVC